MSGAGVLEKMESRKCTICTCRFEDPKITPCGHTFCSRCIDAWYGVDSKKKCPTCRKSVKKSDIQRNYTLNNLLQEIPDSDTEEVENPNIQFFVKTLNGKSITMNLPKITTIKTLKLHIQDREGIPPDQQHLVYRHKRKVLDNHDDETLKSVGIEKETHVEVLLRLRGGKN